MFVVSADMMTSDMELKLKASVLPSSFKLHPWPHVELPPAAQRRERRCLCREGRRSTCWLACSLHASSFTPILTPLLIHL